MAEFNPIGDVGRTLRSLLLDEMATLSVEDEQVALTSPDRFDTDDVGLSLHLYHLQENPQLANESPSRPGGGGGGGPLVLELYYLLTAHPPDGDTVTTEETLSQHQLLSKAVQAFREHSIVTGSELEGSPTDDGTLYISIDPDATDHVLDVWSSFQDTPYLPSVSYVVTPVVIETDEVEPGPRVHESNMDHFSGTSSQAGSDR